VNDVVEVVLRLRLIHVNSRFIEKLAVLRHRAGDLNGVLHVHVAILSEPALIISLHACQGDGDPGERAACQGCQTPPPQEVHLHCDNIRVAVTDGRLDAANNSCCDEVLLLCGYGGRSGCRR